MSTESTPSLLSRSRLVAIIDRHTKPELSARSKLIESHCGLRQFDLVSRALGFHVPGDNRFRISATLGSRFVIHDNLTKLRFRTT